MTAFTMEGPISNIDLQKAMKVNTRNWDGLPEDGIKRYRKDCINYTLPWANNLMGLLKELILRKRLSLLEKVHCIRPASVMQDIEMPSSKTSQLLKWHFRNLS